jgi:hypothetical protein
MGFALGEGAESALEVADIGVIYIAVDHVAHDVAADGLAQRVGSSDDVLIVRVARGEQPYDLGLVQALA